MNKILVVIFIVIIGVSIYSFQSLNEDIHVDRSSIDVGIQSTEQLPNQSSDRGGNRIDAAENESTVNQPANTPKLVKAASDLPIAIQLLGLIYSRDQGESIAQIGYDGNIAEFAVDDEIAQSAVYIARINKKSIVVEFESVDYEIRLGDINSLAEQQLLVEFGQMTAKEIGARPRQIEHIVTLLPNLFNDGGKLILPGRNPDLFNSARFKEGDVLLEVNGFNIDDETSFGELQTHIRTAQTLKFVVNRAGRRVTVYLDIPSEALKL